MVIICILYLNKSFCNNAGYEDEIYAKLKEVENLIVYKKEEMDPSFHYKNNRRIMPIVVSTVEGYRLCQNNGTSPSNATCDQDRGNERIHRSHIYSFVMGRIVNEIVTSALVIYSTCI